MKTEVSAGRRHSSADNFLADNRLQFALDSSVGSDSGSESTAKSQHGYVRFTTRVVLPLLGETKANSLGCLGSCRSAGSSALPRLPSDESLKMVARDGSFVTFRDRTPAVVVQGMLRPRIPDSACLCIGFDQMLETAENHMDATLRNTPCSF